jgi:hypothetical protein
MGGARTGSPNARSVVVIVGWSKTMPTSFMRLPDLSQLSTSILNVRFGSCAQDMRFLLRGFCFSSEVPTDGGPESCASAFCLVSERRVALKIHLV